jgi:hypothetical protein
LVVAVVLKSFYGPKYFVVDECNTSRSVLRRKTTGPNKQTVIALGLGPDTTR